MPTSPHHHTQSMVDAFVADKQFATTIYNNGCIDLHCHSTFSDGTMTPSQLLDLAKGREITILSITDHDTMSGVHEAVQQGTKHGIHVVPGIELSTCHNKLSLHILGYGLDYSNNNLQQLLTTVQKARVDRNRRIIAKLNALNYKIALSQLPKIKDGQLGRPHIAKLLVEKNIVRSESEAFRRFLRRGAAAYAQRDIVTAKDALNVITAANGLAVLAHPGILGLSEASLGNVINELCSIGLDGIEVYHPINSKKTCRFLANICHNKGLLQTGGSDFHGRVRDKSHLGEYGSGRQIPAEIIDVFLSRMNLT